MEIEKHKGGKEPVKAGSELNDGLGALHNSVCQTRGHECEEVDHLWVAIRAWKEEEKLWREREMDLVSRFEKLAIIFEEEVQPYLPPYPGATYADGMNCMARNCARIAREMFSA